MTTIKFNGLDVPLSPTLRLALKCPEGECLGCYLGDASPEVHDIPDACEYLNGYAYEVSA